MAYTLEQFTTEACALLKSGRPVAETVPAIAERLTGLLANDAFVAATFSPEDDFTKKELFHDPETDVYVLAHVHQGPKKGPPHSHGASWAIYGTAQGVTEWRRVNNPTDEAVELAVADTYDLTRGKARGYLPHAIHSTWHPEKAWVIRVTGTNLDKLPRYRFDKTRDRIVEPA